MNSRQSCQRHEIPVAPDKAFRPQSGVGTRNGKGVRKARYSSSRRKYLSSTTMPFSPTKALYSSAKGVLRWCSF